MKGDFTRSSYNAGKRYTSVRMQQGRVQLDADWNEQAEIIQHQIEAPLGDLLGPYAVPKDGFAVSVPAGSKDKKRVPDLMIGKGSCYVDGILCANGESCLYSEQVDFPAASGQLISFGEDCECYVVYLDVWQRLVTCLEDAEIREVALEGADTGARTKTIWQVKLLPVRAGADATKEWEQFAVERQSKRGTLTATQAPDSRVEDNQLYRLEIHLVQDKLRKFKVSRENGSVAYTFKGESGPPVGDSFVVQLDEPDASKVDLKKGDWVELVDAHDELNGVSSSQLFEIDEVHNDDDKGVRVRLCGAWPSDRQRSRPGILRRWDQRAAWLVNGNSNGNHKNLQGGLLVDDGTGALHDLENGIQVKFSLDGFFQANDYWLIPSRAQLNGDRPGILWPPDKPAQPPHGIDHHYAALGLLHAEAGGWEFTPASDRGFDTLPELTAKVARLTERVEELQKTVDGLNGQLQQLRHQLFQDFESEGHLEEGDVVAIHAHRENVVVAATAKNAKRVIGVVAKDSDPKKPGPVCVVLQGTAKCNVAGEVAVGDLLVVAEREKHAKRAGVFVQPGTVIGKALTGYKPQGNVRHGVVDVMITL